MTIAARVAKACCFSFTEATSVGDDRVWIKRPTKGCLGGYDSLLFCPEHNANDAVLAAEQFDLFENCLLAKTPGHWVVFSRDNEAAIATADNFCAVICEAILEMAE